MLRGRGACDGQSPSIFYPESELDDNSDYYAAEVSIVADEFCNTCPVQLECLRVSLEGNEPWGIWGGVGRSERRSMIRRSNTRGLALQCVECGAQLSPAAIRVKVAVCLGCQALPIEEAV